MGTINTGVASSWKVPGIYINVQLGRAVPSAAGSARRVLIIGSKLDESDPDIAAEASVLFEINPRNGNNEPLKADGDLCSVPSLAHAARYFGYGSELYTMAKAAFAANAFVDLWAYVLEEPDSGTRATSSAVAINGTAVGDGYVKVSILGESVTVPSNAGDTAANLAPDVAAVVNARLKHLPYMCTVDSADALVFQAKHTGEIWNGQLQEITPVGSPNLRAGVAVTLQYVGDGITLGPDSVLIGATSSPTLIGQGEYALDFTRIEKQRFHYIVVPCDCDGDNQSLTTTLSDTLANQAEPYTGIRQQGLFGSTAALDVASELTHPVEGVNEPRIQCVWAKGNNYMPGQLAAAVAAVRAGEEAVDPAVNLCRKRLSGVPMTRDADLVNSVSQNAAISDGITPLVPFQGDMVILRSVTCSANRPVAPVSDTGKVTVSDFVADDVELKMLTRYTGFKLSPDTDAALPSNVATPSTIRLSILGWLRVLEAKGVITRVAELSEKVRVEIDPDTDGRINFEIPEDVVDILAVAAGNLIQVG